ncbi:ABC transporter substrate-binding protein [Pimelobacter simplex]|uniref:ABC transporter substrate-binding protein n=1 Tax=Nocardioides simplex TaxID=2045 RepID=UPI00214F6A52|nr:ABC transporter substrate-binding protein [Pimelobacter simplex]UUW91447.1 ABC transporter substrate-binding protein [Pimelobacter simplex]UUW95275.1 ABC transporter substrate-binding protein [Pimelobacter simplex]
MNGRRAAAAVLASLALGASACSVSTTKDDADAGKSGTSKIALPGDIAKQGYLDVGSYFNYPPYTLPDGNDLGGIEADLMRAVAKELGLEVRFHDLAFEAMIPSVVNGRSDVLVGPLADSEERRKEVTFVDTLNTQMSMLVQNGNPKNVDPSDVCGLTAGEAAGSLQESVLKKVAANCEAAGKPKLTLLSFGEVSQPFLSVKNGRIDFTLQDPAVAAYTDEQDDELELVEGHLAEDAPVRQGWVVAKDNQVLAEAFAAAIEKLAEDGTWQAILDKAGLKDATNLPPTINSQPVDAS